MPFCQPRRRARPRADRRTGKPRRSNYPGRPFSNLGPHRRPGSRRSRPCSTSRVNSAGGCRHRLRTFTPQARRTGLAQCQRAVICRQSHQPRRPVARIINACRASSIRRSRTAHLKAIGLWEGFFGVANLISRDHVPELSLPSHCDVGGFRTDRHAAVATDRHGSERACERSCLRRVWQWTQRRLNG